MVKPTFLQVVRKIKGVEPSKTVFTYKELTHYLSQYILDNRSKFFDPRNHMVAICEGDILSEAFGVRAFHRSQVTGFLKTQLIPYKGPSISVVNEMDDTNGADKSTGKISHV